MLTLPPVPPQVAYGVIAGITTGIFLWLCCFLMDIIGSLVFRTRPFREVWLQHNSQVGPADGVGVGRGCGCTVPGESSAAFALAPAQITGRQTVSLCGPSGPGCFIHTCDVIIRG